MDSIFGIVRQQNGRVDEAELRLLAGNSNQDVPGAVSLVVSGEVGMGRIHRAGRQALPDGSPVIDFYGNVLALDGRFDNKAELCHLLELDQAAVRDSEVVLAAFVQWREGCFSRLVGDWAIALWCAEARELYLARDHAGSRTLFFEPGAAEISWSSDLETFRLESKRRNISETFMIHYASGHPLGDLTPYENIKGVLPAHFVRFAQSGTTSTAHWQWWPAGRLSYRTGCEYEEQFFSLFKQSVARRTEPGTPLLAQLSGGMDSTSIVCMSDHIRRQSGARTEDLIDTISYYSETEPDWDERPYFSITEKARGKAGIHLCAAPAEIDLQPLTHWPIFPGSTRASVAKERQREEAIGAGKYEVILSGVGGDELLGGVPSPLPELADDFVSGDWRKLFRQTFAWCIYQRTPMVHMWSHVTKYLYSLYFDPTLGAQPCPPWLTRKAKALSRASAEVYWKRCRNHCQTPSAVTNAAAWWSMLETLPHLVPAVMKRYEYRYPYLDRDLVDFLLQVPRTQLVEPGRRRALMRRALASIVPKEVLERRRKAFISRRNIRALQIRNESIRNYFRSSRLLDRGLLDRGEFYQALDRVIAGSNEWSRQLSATIACEVWLRRVEPISRNLLRSANS